MYSFLPLGYFTQKALSSQIAGDSYNVGGTVCSFCCPVLCCLGAVGLTESGREPCNSCHLTVTDLKQRGLSYHTT